MTKKNKELQGQVQYTVQPVVYELMERHSSCLNEKIFG